MLINFVLTQFVPGGPIEQILSELEGKGDVFESISGSSSETFERGQDERYVGGRGLPPEFIKQLEIEFGFDKPPLQRFISMMLSYLKFDFGESYFQWFPLRGLTSDNFNDLNFIQKILDYFWHIFLPVLASTISSFATLTLLTKNSFLDEIKKHYVTTARAKGISEKKILYGHVFRNAMLIVIAGFPGLFLGVFLSGSLIIETIFSLDGLGRLAFEATVARDYPVVFGTLYFFGLIGLAVGILSDLMYVFVDPRIDFESRQT